MYYDKDGLPITIEQFGHLHSDYQYKRVARTKVTDATNLGKSFDVSTVWLGADHNWGGGIPLIFETMVFESGDAMDLDCRRYTTLAEAEAGHTEMVVVVAATVTDAIVMDTE